MVEGIANDSFKPDSGIAIEYQETLAEEKITLKGILPITINEVDDDEISESEDEDGIFHLLEKRMHGKSDGLLYKILFLQKDNYSIATKYAKPFFILVGVIAFLVAVIRNSSGKKNNTEYWSDGEGFLFITLTTVGIFILYFQVVKKYFGLFICEKIASLQLGRYLHAFWEIRFIPPFLALAFFGTILGFLIWDTTGERNRLQSLVGLAFIVLTGALFSHSPTKIKWRPIIWGFTIQFFLGLLVLRWPLGNSILSSMADKIAKFLFFTEKGTDFIFGEISSTMKVLAFTVLPVTIFFSFITNILYFYGVVQWMVLKLGWLLKISIGTTICESMNASANIFLAMTESPLLIKPYLPHMTKSELHTVMTSGFATVAGSLFGAYASLGTNLSMLLTGCVMNAPASLAISKLYYPETKKTRILNEHVSSLKSNEVNALHAGCVGVANALPLVASITGNLIAFIAFIAFINSVFDWGCQLVSFEEGTCSVEGVLGYIFMPMAWMIGVEWKDCQNVGQLLGIKIVVNEFVAYSHLATFKENNTISQRSETLATFALCGFSNIASIGIIMGSLFPLAPTRQKHIAQVVTRAMIAGSMASISSACIAGLLMS